MKFTYEPRSGEDQVTTIFGQTVEAGDTIDASDLTDAQLAKLKGHPEFNSGAKSETKVAEAKQAKQSEKLAKVVDGRSKKAREARAKADEADAEAQALERARVQAEAVAAAREGNEG